MREKSTDDVGHATGSNRRQATARIATNGGGGGARRRVKARPYNIQVGIYNIHILCVLECRYNSTL